MGTVNFSNCEMRFIKPALLATHLLAAAAGAAVLQYGPTIASKVMPENRQHMALAERMRQRLVSHLKDPDSLKLANTYLGQGDDKKNPPALCGEANARNSMGGYVGFRRFVVTEDMGPWFNDVDDPKKELAYLQTELTWCVNHIADIKFPER